MTFHDWTTGQMLASADLESYAMRQNGKPIGFFTKSASQSINNTTVTAVTFDQESLDTDAAHSTVTNNSRYTAQTAGYYRCYAQVEWGGSATGVRDILFRVNGVATDYLRNHIGTAPGSNHCQATSGILPVRLSVSDYIEVYVNQTSGGALSIATTSGEHFWCVEYVSE